jgi:hypothetical protein
MFHNDPGKHRVAEENNSISMPRESKQASNSLFQGQSDKRISGGMNARLSVSKGGSVPKENGKIRLLDEMDEGAEVRVS